MINAESSLIRQDVYQSLGIEEFAKDDAELTRKSGSAQWIELVHGWKIALHLAQSEQCQLIQSMTKCYMETGVNPTVKQLNNVDELWAAEKQARVAMDAFISERFG